MSATIRTAIAITATGDTGWTSPFGQVISSLQNVAQIFEATVPDGTANQLLVFPTMTSINTWFFYTPVAGFSVRIGGIGNTPFLPLLAGGIVGFANGNHVVATASTMMISYTASPTPGTPGRFYVAVSGT